MNWFARLLRRYPPSPSPLPPTRTPYFDLTDRVDIVRHARAAGVQNLPHTDAVTPDDVECAIEHEFENRHQLSIESTRGDLRAIVEEFAKLEDLIPTESDLEAVPAQAAAAIERMLAEDQTLEHARRLYQERLRIERAFRRRHRLDREPRYPESKPLHLAAVGILVSVESVLNAGFFASMSPIGLAGGLSVAVGISLVNAVCGVGAGYIALRHLHHPRAAVRVVAVAGTAVFVLATVLFNLAVAHLRDSGVPGPGATASILSATLSQPFALSPLGFGLFLLGLAAAAIAAGHGYTLDDPFPGFGEVVRARLEAAEKLKAAHERLRSRVLAEVASVLARCSALMLQAKEHLASLRGLVVQAARRTGRYDSERLHDERWARVLLRRYRSENVSVRTAPAPSYFEDYPSFPSELEGDAVAELTVRLARAREILERLGRTAHAVALQQPARVLAAQRLLEEHARLAAQRADAGRGDGSDPTGSEQRPHGRRRES